MEFRYPLSTLAFSPPSGLRHIRLRRRIFSYVLHRVEMNNDYTFEITISIFLSFISFNTSFLLSLVKVIGSDRTKFMQYWRQKTSFTQLQIKGLILSLIIRLIIIIIAVFFVT